MKSILLVGCGKIGIRHLQAICKISPFPRITVVEPNLKTQKKSKEFLLKDYKKNNIQKISWVSNIEKIHEKFNLVIISTHSTNRIKIVKYLLKKGNNRFVLEKIVCQSKKQYLTLLSELQNYSAKAWINTPYRYFPIYQKLKNYFKQKPLHISVTSNSKGLASNSIHFLDLFSWYLNNYDIHIFEDFLSNKLLKNKRGKNLVEFEGTLIAKNSDSVLSISFLPSSNMHVFTQITNPSNSILIDETDQKIINSNLKTQKLKFEYLHVSQTTKEIVNDILNNDSCFLPSAEKHYLIHCELFRVFNNHIQKLTNKKLSICPIT
jgi:hypothetical protein